MKLGTTEFYTLLSCPALAAPHLPVTVRTVEVSSCLPPLSVTRDLVQVEPCVRRRETNCSPDPTADCLPCRGAWSPATATHRNPHHKPCGREAGIPWLERPGQGGEAACHPAACVRPMWAVSPSSLLPYLHLREGTARQVTVPHDRTENHLEGAWSPCPLSCRTQQTR